MVSHWPNKLEFCSGKFFVIICGVGLKSNGSFRDFPYYGKIIKSKYCSRKKKKQALATASAKSVLSITQSFSVGHSIWKIKSEYCPRKNKNRKDASICECDREQERTREC